MANHLAHDLESLPLRPGDTLELHRPNGSPETKARATLVGIGIDQYLLVRHPLVHNLPMFKVPGSNCQASFRHQGELYGFRSRVSHLLAAPEPLICLDYPETISRQDQRRRERRQVRLPATARQRDAMAPPVLPGVITDLTEQGCRLTLDRLFDLGRELELSFVLTPVGRVDWLPCRVVNLWADWRGGYRLGLSFLERHDQLSFYLRRMGPNGRQAQRHHFLPLL